MLRWLRWSVAIAPWIAYSAVAFGGDAHEDKRVGYKFDPPTGWEEIALKTDEKWIIAKYQSDKTYFANDKSTGWTNEHKPQLRVIAFVADVVNNRGAKVTKEGENKFVIEFGSQYKDYKDFLRQTHSGGGYHVADEKEKTINGVKVTALDIRVEKLAYGGARRICTYIFHVPDVDLAVEFEALDNAYGKIENAIDAAYKSFKTIKRTEGALAAGDINTGDKFVFEDTEKLSPAERKQRKTTLANASYQKATAKLPSGWKAQMMGRFYVLNHADEKIAGKYVAQGDAILNWLDKNFDFFGKGEFVRNPILRICANEDEERAFSSGLGYWGANSLEIVTHKSDEGSTSWEFEWVNNRVKDHWLRERDRELALAMPNWLSSGLERVFGAAKLKGGGLEFDAGVWEKVGLRENIRAKTATSPRQLLTMGGEDFYKQQNRSDEAGALVRYLLAGPGAKDAKTKDLLKDYLVALKAVITEMNKKDGDGGEEQKKPTTEEEEEEAAKNRRKGYREKEKKILEDTAGRVFAKWSDADWKNFEDTYFVAIK